jgi:hypothetical protein
MVHLAHVKKGRKPGTRKNAFHPNAARMTGSVLKWAHHAPAGAGVSMIAAAAKNAMLTFQDTQSAAIAAMIVLQCKRDSLFRQVVTGIVIFASAELSAMGRAAVAGLGPLLGGTKWEMKPVMGLTTIRMAKLMKDFCRHCVAIITQNAGIGLDCKDQIHAVLNAGVISVMFHR